MHNYTASIVGARGYTGLELAKILLKHPHIQLTHCFATQKFALTQYLDVANAAKVTCLADSEIFNHLTDIVFLATPAEVSLELAPKIIAAGKKVVDLSGAFRLKKNDYKKWYGFEHNQTQLLAQASYGLLPLVGPAKNTQLVANPGCYASATILALAPLLKHQVIDFDSITIDAKSGTTGGGRKAAENLLFTEVEGECLPYKVGKHQHFPEIQEALEQFTGVSINPHFTTSLLATRRGIIAGVYAKLQNGKTLTDVKNAYQQMYGEYSLINFAPIKEKPELLSLKRVLGTNKTNISFEVEDSKLYVFSVIDNLVKGAAGQAVENLNRMLDLQTDTGLTHLENLL